MAYISLDLVAYCHTPIPAAVERGEEKDSKELTYCQLLQQNTRAQQQIILQVTTASNQMKNKNLKFAYADMLQ